MFTTDIVSRIRALRLLALAGVTVLSAQGNSANLSGAVQDWADAPLADVNAELELEQAPHTLFSLRLDDGGRFRFTVLPSGKYTLTIAVVGFKTLNVRSIQVTSGEQKIVPLLRMELAPTDMPWMPSPVFNLHPGDQRFGNLAGRVMRSETRPPARATVQLFCDDQPCGETKTDANGDFIFFNLAPRGDYAFRISHPGFYTWQGQDYTAFEVLAGYDAIYQPIVLRPRTKLSRAAR